MSGEIPTENVNGNNSLSSSSNHDYRSSSTPPQVSPEMLFKISKKIAQLTKVRMGRLLRNG